MTQRRKISERSHIEQQGEFFDAALAAATRSVRGDTHFVGMDKIRGPVAKRAALRATGFQFNDDDDSWLSWLLPESADKNYKETFKIVEALYRTAVEAAIAGVETFKSFVAEQVRLAEYPTDNRSDDCAF
jgi:hypothetical protein